MWSSSCSDCNIAWHLDTTSGRHLQCQERKSYEKILHSSLKTQLGLDIILQGNGILDIAHLIL